MHNPMDDIRIKVNTQKPSFIQQLRIFMRSQNKTWATEKTYILWIRRFIFFHNKRHPKEMGANEVNAFLNHLSVDRNCSPATQALALNALSYLYNQFLQKELGKLEFQPSRRTPKIPVVFTSKEANLVIENLAYP